ncbi:TauD/TfdA dioxygenase family protein [Limnohabitans sp. T6-5]|uniref:TauD/TfdA dioxygenase family protein n=1 Tax=Limnohabitans sp. T6-5 TaxID=1100724 RepID=UPI003511C184
MLETPAWADHKARSPARLRWQPNTLAMWDNRSTQHYAVGDYFPQHRKLQRITFTADQAF